MADISASASKKPYPLISTWDCDHKHSKLARLREIFFLVIAVCPAFRTATFETVQPRTCFSPNSSAGQLCVLECPATHQLYTTSNAGKLCCVCVVTFIFYLIDTCARVHCTLWLIHVQEIFLIDTCIWLIHVQEYIVCTDTCMVWILHDYSVGVEWFLSWVVFVQ